MGQNFSSEPVVEKETERAENETFKAAVSSCQGWRMSQEDNHSLMLELPQSEHKASFFAVYDGHGSARISKYASEGLWQHLIENPNYKEGNFKEALEQAFLSFDKEVNESHNAQLAGTTAICVLIVDNVIYCANIGDSRAVASINCECEPLSHDHKPDNPEELKRIIAAGGYVLGNRVNGNLALSRAFGDFHYKSNGNLGPEKQIVSPCPDIKRIELNDDVDFIVLACDGIWDVLTSEEVVKFVIAHIEHAMEPGLICEQLTNRCMATDYELVIGCDNMTVLLVCHTRGRSWSDYCTDIFNKNTKKLGVPRTRSFNPADLEDDTDVHRRRQQQLRQQQLHEEEDRKAATFLQGAAGGFSGDASGRTSGSDDFASHIPRDIRILLDAMRITEVPPDDDSDSRVDSTASSEADPSGQDSSGSAERKDSEQDSVSNDVGDNEAVSKTTKIYLAGPDDESDGVDENKDGDGSEREAVTGEPVSNTIEVELASPDDDNNELKPDSGDALDTQEIDTKNEGQGDEATDDCSAHATTDDGGEAE